MARTSEKIYKTSYTLVNDKMFCFKMLSVIKWFSSDIIYRLNISLILFLFISPKIFTYLFSYISKFDKFIIITGLNFA